MKYFILPFAILGVLGLHSCREEYIPSPTMENTVSSDTIYLNYGDSLTLSANATDARSILWMSNGTILGKGKQLNYKAYTAGTHTIQAIASNAGGTSTLKYNIRVYGKYVDGTLVITSTSDKDKGSLFFIKNNVAEEILNTDGTPLLGESAVSGQFRNGLIYVPSQQGNPYITILDAETMEVKNTITESVAKSPSYINFYKNKPYITNSRRPAFSIYPLDMTSKSIQSSISGATNVPAIQSSALQVGNHLLFVNGTSIMSYDGANSSLVKNYGRNISGILSGENNHYWVAIQKPTTGSATFEHYNQNMELVETIELPTSLRLPRNSNISTSDNKTFYWQETSTGTLHRFNTSTKTSEKVATPMEYGISFTTNIKAHPKTGDIYICGVTDFLEQDGVVVILDGTTFSQKAKYNIGKMPVDFVFLHKSLFR